MHTENVPSSNGLLWKAKSMTGVQLLASAKDHVIFTLGKSTLIQPW